MSDVTERITAYLASGGMFNPELANHAAVRDLLIDARAELAAVRFNLTEAAIHEARLMEKLRVARDALEPFAALWDVEETYLIGGLYTLRVKYEDIKRARDALKGDDNA